MIKQPCRNPSIALLAALLFAVLAAGTFLSTKPFYSHESLWEADKDSGSFELPFVQKKAVPGQKTLRFTMRVGYFHPVKFKTYVQNVVDYIKVNGQRIDYYAPGVVNLAPYLHAGDNSIEVGIRSFSIFQAYFYWFPALADFWLQVLIALCLCSLGFGLRWIQLIRPTWMKGGEAIILLSAFAIRMAYVCATPYFLRAYDWDGHLTYVQFVAKHLAIPPYDLDYETYQPPLFYGLLGLLGHAVYGFGGSYESALIAWQLATLGLAALTLAAALWIARLLFPDEAHYKWRLWLLAALALVPGLVFFSSRINNDSLFAPISYAFLGALLCFWKYRRWGTLIAASVFTGLGLLTKSNAMIFVPILGMTLFFAADMNWKRKAQFMAVYLAIIGAIAGWFVLKRATVSRDSASFIVASLGGVDQETQRITPTVTKFLTFNPIEMVKKPFMWVGKSQPRHDHFPEFFFQTALFSEGTFGLGYIPLVRVILISALFLLAFSCWGLLATVRSTASLGWPLAVTILGFVSAQMLYVVQLPFACCQNFRFSILLLAPVLYFAFKGMSVLPGAIQRFGVIIAGIFVGTSALCILLLAGTLDW